MKNKDTEKEAPASVQHSLFDISVPACLEHSGTESACPAQTD